MAAYLIVDVDNLLQRFRLSGMAIDLQELAVGLRGAAALAAGLASADRLKAIALADWDNQTTTPKGLDPQLVFRVAGYEVFDVKHRESLADVLIIHYFSYDPEPIDELILATTSRDLLPLIRRITLTRSSRIRMWGSEDVLKGTEFADSIIFQPLETLLGIQSKNVAVYIDFENIAISLNEQGYVVNLDHLIERIVSRATQYGQVVKMSAYAPWGQRGTLPPLVDSAGREVADDAPSRMMLANIDPVFNLPGKNSADIRIARDVITAAAQPDSPDIYIVASGDRDFNEVLNALVQRGKSVIIWGVRGSTSRMLENHPGITVEYIEDFTNLATHKSLSKVAYEADPAESFVPSQWSSIVMQFDRMAARLGTTTLRRSAFVEQLIHMGVVVNADRANDLLSQAQTMGMLQVNGNSQLTLNATHPIVEKTRAIYEAIQRRVANTLKVRGWEYVNYGFLLKGLEMEPDINRPGMNENDQWRSHWIDSLVREQILKRELVPHRHNPDDLVPVIRLPLEYEEDIITLPGLENSEEPLDAIDWSGTSIAELAKFDPNAANMTVRIIVSVQQFTSFRSFIWCPLGSLHKRLRAYDTNMAFQRAVEYLEANNIVRVDEYPNPQSDYNTKGISINLDAAYTQAVLNERDEFVRILLVLYENNQPITQATVDQHADGGHFDYDLWFSIMETENVLNALPGRTGQYSLFRTHHTVKIVAGDSVE
ncbi:MAG: NYN domain-containing protein [Anaerolineae bacterium]|nr:NYN domain-containing protein [Anaerolineae bacterium]MCA9888068.1 NYN domain-containing protein [Anaerolineae bacterium]MCA9893522.1 NYN domain-containing protein [Anaerolineae bacterium]MCB9459141.1 NYN domain-containing protein [Anaerolineaceae bacterium]